MLPGATLAAITRSGVAARPSNHEHSSNRDANGHLDVDIDIRSG
jgi:hypothetical protein